MSDYPSRHLVVGADDPFASCFATSYACVVSFLAVANEGSFARAGDRLGIGRSAVSRNVQKLEAQLDARLFQRTTRSTSLTREGELFYANCQPGMERIVQALEDMRELRSGPPCESAKRRFTKRTRRIAWQAEIEDLSSGLTTWALARRLWSVEEFRCAPSRPLRGVIYGENGRRTIVIYLHLSAVRKHSRTPSPGRILPNAPETDVLRQYRAMASVRNGRLVVREWRYRATTRF